MSQVAEKTGQKAEKHESKATQIKDAAFNWEDPLDLEGELSEEERMVRDTARDYAQEKLFPRVIAAYRDEKYRPGDRQGDGRARAARPDHPGGIRRRRSQLCLLRPDRARDRARRFRLSLADVGDLFAGDAPDLCLWQRGAAQEISAEAGEGRNRRLLRPDRARSRLRSGLDGDARREGRGRL